MTPDCALCHAPQPVAHYTGVIRAGSFGKWTPAPFTVYDCAECGVGFLNPVPDVSYESGQYRSDYNNSARIEEYFALHDQVQLQHLEMFRGMSFRDLTVADFGCGGGAFLDQVRGLARETIAIEPFVGYHASLRERGHRVYQYGADLLADNSAPRADVAVSLHVIEHVPDPVTYLREMRAALAPGGVVYLVTPNYDDILLKLVCADYAPFFYRTAHLWYFNARSLRWAAERAGFTVIDIRYQHNYDLSNALLWARDRRPTGVGRLSLFDAPINAAWRTFLEASGQADAVWAILRP